MSLFKKQAQLYIIGYFTHTVLLCKLNPSYLKLTFGKRGKQTKSPPYSPPWPPITTRQFLEYDAKLTIIHLSTFSVEGFSSYLSALGNMPTCSFRFRNIVVNFFYC